MRFGKLFLVVLGMMPVLLQADYEQDRRNQEHNRSLQREDLRLQEQNQDLQNQDIRLRERNQQRIDFERRQQQQTDAEIQRDQLEFERLNKQR